MLASKETDKTLFKHIVKKVEAEKSELLNSVNKEITRKRDSYRKNPIVYVLYRIPSDKFYTEYGNNKMIRELRFSSATDILVFKIPASDHKPLTMEQFDTISNGYFYEINQVLLGSDSVKISDNMALDDYFKDLQNNHQNDNLEFHWFQIGDLLQSYRLSIFDIDGKTAAIALAYLLDIYFFSFKHKNRDIESFLEQIKLIVLKSGKNWSIEFLENIKSTLHTEFVELSVKSSIIEKMRLLEQLFDDIISLKNAESAIETASQS